MASLDDKRGQLSRALLEDQQQTASRAIPTPEPSAFSAPSGFLGIDNDDNDSDADEAKLSTTPVIMGSPFPYLFEHRYSKKRPEMAIPSSIEEGMDAPGPQPSKLVKSLVHASSTQPDVALEASGREESVSTTLRYEARKRAHRRTEKVDGTSVLTKKSPLSKALIIGLVNVVVGVPALISYTAIIFQAPEFKESVGELAQLLFLASAITQAVFCLRSTLPFAVGQTQDVGLIFLSAMASGVAASGSAAGLPTAEIVGTTLITCLIATTLVGVFTILVGKFELAGLVQYIPLPVVGGYLAYVGFFCLVAGTSVSINMPLDNFQDVMEVLKSPEALYMTAAAVASMLLILFSMRFQHPAALPIALVTVPLSFHAVLLATGHSLTEAQDAGWVIKPNGSEAFWKVYELYNVHDWKFSGTYWPAVAQQVPKMIALFFVVAFGSSMDVAAIQQDMPEPLDFNGELITVGLANLGCSAVGAGFTGSYIFSQTIFTSRQGVFNVANGWVIAIAELALFLLPVSVVEYMPNFFYGSLLMVFGVDISRDWLLESFHKVSLPEYILLLATFFAVIAQGLEIGIAIGIVLATMYFAFEYAKIRVTTFRVVPSRSGALRTFRQQAVLDLFSNRMKAIGLQGYIFFGAALKIGEKCMEVADDLSGQDTSLDTALQVTPSSGSKLFSSDMDPQVKSALNKAPKFLLLDFRQVEGLDATAARTFGTIANQLHTMRIDLIITGVQKPSIRYLLQAHGAISQESHEYNSKMALTFPSMDAGAQFCEECFLEVAVTHGLLEPSTKTLSLTEILTVTLEAPHFPLPPGVSLSVVAEQLQEHMVAHTMQSGQVLFDIGDDSLTFYVIQRGSMRLEFPQGVPQVPVNPVVTLQQQGAATTQSQATKTLSVSGLGTDSTTLEYGPGGFVGDYDFFMGAPRSFRAVTGSFGCELLALSRSAFTTLLQHSPQAISVLQAVLLRNACINERHSMDHILDDQ